MSTVLLCNRDLASPVIQQACNLNLQQLSAPHCPNPKIVRANTPYLVNGHSDSHGKRIQNLLSPPQVARSVTDFSLTFGEDNTIAIATMMDQLRDYNIALTGASTTVYGQRIEGFALSVKQYQEALLSYRDAKLSRANNQAQLRQQAHIAFQKMQARFKAELNAVTSHIRSRRGTPLTSAERGTNIASGSRNTVKLQFNSEIEAHRLVRLSSYTKILGNGLAVIDFGSRVGKVHNSYQAGGNWERDLFIESSSFAASATAGTLIANAGVGLLLAATPLGWTALIVGGLLVAGSAAAAAVVVNDQVQKNSGEMYDKILDALD